TGSVTFTGAGGLFDTAYLNVQGSNSNLTIGPGVTIQGTNGTVNGDGNPLDNLGTIDANPSFGNNRVSLTVTGTGWTNDGTPEATNGASLSLTGSWINKNQILVNASALGFDGSWTNQGTLTSQGASNVYLGGTFGLGNLGTYHRDAAGQDIFVINGTFDLAGQTLDASAGPGVWALGNGTLANGGVNVSVVTRPPNFFRSAGTLRDITLGGTLTYNATDDEFVAGSGLTLAGGTVTIGSSSTLNFSGSQ